MRRAAHEGLHKGAAKDFYPGQEKEAILLTEDILKDPDHWDDHFQRYIPVVGLAPAKTDLPLPYSRTTSSTIMSMVYDAPVLQSHHDSSIAGVNDFIGRLVHAANPGAYFVEYFPWMKYIPSSIAKWKRDAEAWYEKDSEMFEGLYGDVEKRIVSPIFTTSRTTRAHRKYS
jgi:hypothetical protein